MSLILEELQDAKAVPSRGWQTYPDPRSAAIELSIVMPCLNEARTVAQCVRAARDFLERNKVLGEVLVADNGSTDDSRQLAQEAGARIVVVAERGYGAALMEGIRSARGRYVIMGDADQSYDFADLDSFLRRLRAGSDLVMGNRFLGGVLPDAMPPLHRYLGNPVLSWIGRVLFKSSIGDFHCGLRGFDRASILSLDLRAPGMEFASEMVVKATLAGLVVSEVPTCLRPDGRDRPPHLRTWRDGWRHLKFLLMMSPRWLLLYPGLLLLSIGLAGVVTLVPGPLRFGDAAFDIHTLLYASGASILGLQLVIFSLVARSIGELKGLLPPTEQSRRLARWFSLERGLLFGILLSTGGMAMALRSVGAWIGLGMASVDPGSMMRLAIPAVALLIAGAEIAFASFVLAMIDPGRRDPTSKPVK